VGGCEGRSGDLPDVTGGGTLGSVRLSSSFTLLFTGGMALGSRITLSGLMRSLDVRRLLKLRVVRLIASSTRPLSNALSMNDLNGERTEAYSALFGTLSIRIVRSSAANLARTCCWNSCSLL
jgi:hypothetical protein